MYNLSNRTVDLCIIPCHFIKQRKSKKRRERRCDISTETCCHGNMHRAVWSSNLHHFYINVACSWKNEAEECSRVWAWCSEGHLDVLGIENFAKFLWDLDRLPTSIWLRSMKYNRFSALRVRWQLVIYFFEVPVRFLAVPKWKNAKVDVLVSQWEAEKNNNK